jgi:hypothetical protein
MNQRPLKVQGEIKFSRLPGLLELVAEALGMKYHQMVEHATAFFLPCRVP